MFYLRQYWLLIRHVHNLTDLLAWGQANGSAVHVFKWMGVHEGVHEMCPGWCPCDVDLGLDDEVELLIADEAVA